MIGIVELDERSVNQYICCFKAECNASSIGYVKGDIEFRPGTLDLVAGNVNPGMFQVVSLRIETLLSTVKLSVGMNVIRINYTKKK